MKEFYTLYTFGLLLYFTLLLSVPSLGQSIIQSVKYKYKANGELISAATSFSRSLKVKLEFVEPLIQIPNSTFFSVYSFKFNTAKCGLRLELLTLTKAYAEVNIIAPPYVGIDMLEFGLVSTASSKHLFS